MPFGVAAAAVAVAVVVCVVVLLLQLRFLLLLHCCGELSAHRVQLGMWHLAPIEVRVGLDFIRIEKEGVCKVAKHWL